MRLILFTVILWHMKPTTALREEGYVIRPSGLHNESFFGYSMAFLNNELVISAPKADSTGQIYVVNTETNSIDKIDFGLTEDYSIKKRDYWLGATVSKGSSFFVTCAPRTIIRTGTGLTTTSAPCFTFQKDRVTRLQSRYYNDYRFNGETDSFGWSINVDALDKIYIGSPLLYSGFRIPTNRQKSVAIITFSAGYVEVYYTTISLPYILTNVLKSFNFGYAIATGNFLSDDENDTNFAVSSTYGDYGEGKVFIFNSDNKEVYRISNDEVGSTYGATLCTLRLEGKRSSLLVGAPTYSTNHHEYDHGAVYLYVPNYSNTATEKMILKSVIKGTSNSGYFGFSIANIGDIDCDGKDDVAIGAPYEDDGKGAVYIYSGYSLLTDRKYLKKLQNSQYVSFGLSLTPLTDSKANTIGIAVSAPYDNTVILYKVMPLITTKLYVQVPKLQAREDKTKFEFTACVNLTYPKTTKTIGSEIILKTEITHPYAKLNNATADGSIIDRIELKRRLPSYCKTYQVLTPNKGDYGIMIKYNITTAIENTEKKSEIDITKVDYSDISVRHLEGEIWAADCDITYGRCFPDLVFSLETTMLDPYEVGSSDTEQYSMMITNEGETAYNLCFVVTLNGTHISNYPPTCIRTDVANQVICKPIEPLPFEYSWNPGDIIIDTSFVTNELDEIEIQTDVYNNCTDRTDKETIQKTFKLIYNFTGINVEGIANPYKDINITTVDAVSGKSFEHLYMIRNKDSTDYLNANFEVTLEKREYLKWMMDEKLWNCSLVDSTETIMYDSIKYTCKIDNLHRNSDVNIHIPVQIVPDTLGKYITDEINITSSLILKLQTETKGQSLTTTLHYTTTSVAAWIIILAIIIGLIVLVIIALILREMGFFQRKNKKNLEDLKTSVINESIRRQSQRQSNREQTEQTEHNQQNKETDSGALNGGNHSNSKDKLC